MCGLVGVMGVWATSQGFVIVMVLLGCYVGVMGCSVGFSRGYGVMHVVSGICVGVMEFVWVRTGWTISRGLVIVIVLLGFSGGYWVLCGV